MKIAAVAFMYLLLFLSACSQDTGVAGPAKINVDFVWDLKHPERSPEIHLENNPVGVDRLEIEFFDATNEWEHGGGSIAYDGSGIIRAGALPQFKGLSSTWGFPKFRVTVEAFNKNGQLVGRGTITKSPPSQ